MIIIVVHIMPQIAQIYRALIASPSDCVGERTLIPDVLRIWNASHTMFTGMILEPVLWETHARPEMGDRPQAIINKQLVDHCDLLIGTFWTRLGTETGKAASGTAEEIEEFRAMGKPVLLYFSRAQVMPSRLDPKQYDALMEYKRGLSAKGLYFEYDSVDDLGSLLFRHVSAIMAGLHALPIAEDRAKEERISIPDRSPSKHELFHVQFQLFVRRLEFEWKSERDSKPMNTEEGKLIMASALQKVLDFSSELEPFGIVQFTMEECMRRMRTLMRHQLTTGEESFREFWFEGTMIIEQLKNAITQIPRGEGA